MKLQINREQFEAWLFSQPDDRTYDYKSNDNCLICRFFKETTNITGITVGGSYFRQNQNYVNFEEWLSKLMNTWNPRVSASVPLSSHFGTVKKLYRDFFPESVDETLPAPMVKPEIVKAEP